MVFHENDIVVGVNWRHRREVREKNTERERGKQIVKEENALIDSFSSMQ